jgi:hypothetical protein
MDRIDALRLLLDVAEAGSFSGVARQRTIATSTVALAVSQLEQEFGARLLTRSTRRLVFTHEGDSAVVWWGSLRICFASAFDLENAWLRPPCAEPVGPLGRKR